MMEYLGPVQRGEGWWFARNVDDGTFIWFGPYPDELNCHYNLQRLRREQIATPQGGLQQNLFDSPSWRSVVQDIFGPASIEAFPPRGSRG